MIAVMGWKPSVRSSDMKPLWIQWELILLRDVTLDRRESVWAPVCLYMFANKLCQSFRSGGFCEMDMDKKRVYPEEETTMMARGLTKSVSNSVRLPLPSSLALSIMSGFESTQNINLRLTSTAKPSGLTRSTNRPYRKYWHQLNVKQLLEMRECVCVCVLTCINEDLRLSSRSHRRSVDCSRRQICPIDSVLSAVIGYSDNYRTLDTHTKTQTC